MADCELLPTCLFFSDKIPGMPATASILKKKYCQGDNTECARHIVFKALGRGHVPRELFPGMIDKAKDIILLNKNV